MTGWSDGHRELVEGFAEPVAGRDIGGEFVVAAVQILDERVPGGENTRGAVVWVPITSSTSCDQAIFVDHAADTGLLS